ncbi:SDR family oxidoreductase, partial [Candidatus Gracilibacteria bacterium]|nr:SDR family oxidoreductase [Candidatus Gracilibacteria bacterium]
MTSLSTTVLITGASSGIGREFAHIFAKKGYNLILVARRRDLLEDIKTEYKNIHIEIIEKDLSVSGSVGELYEAVQAKNLQVDILINNAGFGDFGYFHEGDIQKYREMIQLNITALTELCYMFGKEMISRNNGKILNVASTAAFQPGPLMSVYFATKHYVLAFSEGIAEEWSQYGVVVTALCPGPTESGFQVGARATQNKMFTKKLPSSSEVAEYGYSAL